MGERHESLFLTFSTYDEAVPNKIVDKVSAKVNCRNFSPPQAAFRGKTQNQSCAPIGTLQRSLVDAIWCRPWQSFPLANLWKRSGDVVEVIFPLGPCPEEAVGVIATASRFWLPVLFRTPLNKNAGGDGIRRIANAPSHVVKVLASCFNGGGGVAACSEMGKVLGD